MNVGTSGCFAAAVAGAASTAASAIDAKAIFTVPSLAAACEGPVKILYSLPP